MTKIFISVRCLVVILYLSGDDYQTIYAYDNDDEIKIRIYQNGVLWWDGFFGKFDGEWDEDACTFTVEPTVDDDYTCLKHEGEEEYNILNYCYNSGDVIVDFAYL